jgi:hypothetical protein
MARALAAGPFFAVATFLAIRTWNPLGNGYLADYQDSPDGLYLTMAAIGLALALLFAAVGLLIAWRAFQRYGFLLVAALAVVAGALPYVLFKWTSDSETWPWAFLVEDWISWLGFAPRARTYGIGIQVLLALITVASVVAHFTKPSIRPRAASLRRSTI